jgi:hypothetical protein
VHPSEGIGVACITSRNQETSSAVNSTQMSSFSVMVHVHRDRFIVWLQFDGYRSDFILIMTLTDNGDLYNDRNNPRMSKWYMLCFCLERSN